MSTKELYRLHFLREIAKADLEMEYTKLLIEVKKEVDMILLFKVLIIFFFLPQQLKNKTN